jgi:hypothetical protein
MVIPENSICAAWIPFGNHLVQPNQNCLSCTCPQQIIEGFSRFRNVHCSGGVPLTRAIDGSFQEIEQPKRWRFRSTKLAMFTVQKVKLLFNGSGVSSIGLFHTALFTVLRNRILPDYIAMVESIKCPADVGILKRSFESTFALLVPVVNTKSPTPSLPN